MGRSGYSDECDEEFQNQAELYRRSVKRAIEGKRGQAFLREMAAALDAMPVKELVAGEIVRDNTHVCAMGSVALARGMDVAKLDVDDGAAVGKAFGIAESMAREIAWLNDEYVYFNVGGDETPAARWRRMREWVRHHISGGVCNP